MTDDRTPTHTAYALRREGKRMSRWLEIGKARLKGDTKIIHVALDRTPVGGFNKAMCTCRRLVCSPRNRSHSRTAARRGFIEAHKA